MRQVETQEYFDALADTWDQRFAADSGLIRSVLQLVGCEENPRILDIACGTGIMIPFLLELQPEELTAIDLSPNMVAVAQGKHSDPCLTIRQDDFYQMEHRAGYDLAVVYNAYPHFLDKHAFCLKLWESLGDDGRFLVMHGSSRHVINAGHTNASVSPLSSSLGSVWEERSVFLNRFRVDMAVDTDRFYLLSGVKKPKDHIQE